MERKKHLRKAISLEMKIAILDRLAKGEGSTAIGKHLNLGESTIRAIKKNEYAIRKSVISGTKLSAKLSSYSRDALLEKTERALVIWIEELTQRRVPISGYLIKQKALQFYERMKQSKPSTSHADKEFSASKGWLTGFFKRNALHNVRISGEVASAGEGAAKHFPGKLAKIIADGGYCSHQVFNADETRLFWKKMPGRTYLAKSEKEVNGLKASKDRVTLLLCCNASGDRVLKPLLVNRFLRPRALKGKDLKQLPVHWMANTKSCVRTAVFTEWFNNCFVPEVEAYVKQKGLDFKVILILDNAPGQPHLEHPNVKVVFFPPNSASSVQPLDQGVFAAFKKLYVKRTYQFLLDKLENESATVTEVWNRFSILDCLNHVASAIAEMRPDSLNACWKAVWPGCVANTAANQTSTLSDEIITLARDIGGEGFDTFSQSDLDELLADDALSDNDIIGVTLDIVEDPENDCEAEEKPVGLTANLIREGLQLCNKLENHFLVNDTNSERAFKLQRELKSCMSGYRELYKKLVQSSSRSFIADYVARGKQSTPNENEVGANSACEEPLALLCRSNARNASTADESDFATVPKRCRILSDRDDNSDEKV